MYLDTLLLRQFRSYNELFLKVHPGVNLFLGLNASGKTNLLEAIAVLTTGMSPRGAETESLIQWSEKGFYIRGTFQDQAQERDELTLEMKFEVGSSRVIRENGKALVRLKDLIGRIPIVSFVPEDLAMIKGEPDLRRRALNLILMQVDRVYVSALKKYHEALRSRNAALRQVREGDVESEALDPWDQAVVELGLSLCQKRNEFISDFSERVSTVHERISGGKEKLTLVYRPSFSGPWDKEAASRRWHEKMMALRSQEVALGLTMVGPHRDDVEFLINGRMARHYASEGQRRTSALAFKLAELPYIQEKRGVRPLCLLDDVLSELDMERATHLLNELSQTGQCFVTLTGLESWPKDQALPATIFQVDEKGVLARDNETVLSRS